MDKILNSTQIENAEQLLLDIKAINLDSDKISFLRGMVAAYAAIENKNNLQPTG